MRMCVGVWVRMCVRACAYVGGWVVACARVRMCVAACVCVWVRGCLPICMEAQCTCPSLASPRLASPRLASPRLASPRLPREYPTHVQKLRAAPPEERLDFGKRGFDSVDMCARAQPPHHRADAPIPRRRRRVPHVARLQHAEHRRLEATCHATRRAARLPRAARAVAPSAPARAPSALAVVNPNRA